METEYFIPTVSNIDMSDIHRELYYQLGNEHPAFLIFEDQPGGDMRLQMPNGEDVLYFNNCENICDKIIDEMLHPHIPVYDAPDFVIHSLDEATVSWLNSIGFVISIMLNIPFPQIEFRDHMLQHATSVAENNLVTLRTVQPEFENFMVRSMAHELRHLWQYKYHPEIFEAYTPSSDDVEGYLSSSAEQDAEAFASRIVMEAMGFDDISTNENYAGGNKEIQKQVMELREKIMLDKEGVELLRDMCA